MKHILFKYTIIVLLYLLCTTHIAGQNIVINEFMSDNESVIQDKDGDFSDWIELYNNSNNSVNLLNYRLSDDLSEPDKWLFPEITIQPHSFILIFASGKNISDTSELHTNFKIKKSGENLCLSNSQGIIINSIDPVSLPADNSYGCIPDGNQTLGLFILPTPNSSNAGSNGVSCSHPSGFYNQDFFLSLTPANPNHQIHYTLNGEIPTKNSLLFSSDLHIESNTASPNNISLIPTTPLEGPYPLSQYIWKEPGIVYKGNIVRFASFDDSAMQSQVFTKTYFIDQDIENHYSFPIISVVTDSLNLFNYDTGIYIPGKTFDENGFNWWAIGNYHNRGSEWERNIHISYFENDGALGFETDAGMRMRGHGSTANPQKSFGVYFRSEYGLSEIDYPIFKNSNTDIYKRLIFRNSGNDFIHTHFKDALLQGLLKLLDLELQNFHPSVVFFNGEYWGIHCIREKYDKFYFKNHFGIQEDNINILGICGDPEEGTNSDYIELTNFIKENDMSLAENYSFAKTKVDIQNFIDFQIAEIYYANYDWPGNNFKIWKTNDPGSKWRFLIYDLDYSFAYNNNSLYDTPSLEHATSIENSWPHAECSNLIFRKFLENEEFGNQFIDRFAYHLNTTFNHTLIIDSINKFEALFVPEIEEHIYRWGYPSTLEKWHENIDVLKEFANKRPCYMREHIMEFFDLSQFDFDCYYAIDEPEKENKIVLFPNPGNGIFYISNNSPESINGNITITSITGKVVYIENNINLSGYGRKYINQSELPNNTYIFNFYNTNFSERRKIVIIK